MTVYTLTNIAKGAVWLAKLDPLEQYATVTITDNELSAEILDAQAKGLISISPDPIQVSLQNYEGQVATRCYVPNFYYTDNKQAMWRSSHYARENMTSLRLAFANWYVAGAGIETDAAAATIHVSVEYPAGTFTRVTFSGSDAGELAAGATLFSDKVRLTAPIPYGALFWVRTHYSSAGGLVFNTSLNGNTYTPFGEGAMYGVTTPDLTMGGDVGNMGSNNGYAPVLILSQTNRPAVAVFGDSRAFGVSDVMDRSGDVGEVARSLGSTLAYANASVSGDQAVWFLANHAKRKVLADYCTHVVVQYGINDLTNGRTSGQVIADLDAIAALFPTKPVWQTTITPKSATTDNWQSVDGQTTDAVNTERTATNDSIRSGLLTNVNGYFDVADAVETARNSGIWLAWHTSDGLHANRIGNLKVRASGAISVAMFAR